MKNHEPFFSSITLQPLNNDLYSDAGLNVRMLRADLIDPVTGGNKWFKLYYYFEKARRDGFTTLASMGGAYSNHLAALARMGKQAGVKTIGFIRGEPPKNLNTTLHRAEADGMELRFVSRSFFRELRENGASVQSDIPANTYFIPEGGASAEGINGAAMMAQFIPSDCNYILLPVGTGTTMAGLITGIDHRVEVVGIGTVKADGYPENSIEEIVNEYTGEIIPVKWKVLHDYTFGGFAKVSDVLNNFVNQWNEGDNPTIEPIYTGRLLFAFHDLIEKGYFPRGSLVILIHTGGLQYLLNDD